MSFYVISFIPIVHGWPTSFKVERTLTNIFGETSISSHCLVNASSPCVNTLPVMGDIWEARPPLDASTMEGSTVGNLGDSCSTIQEYIKQIERVKYIKKHPYQMKPFKPKVDLQADLQDVRVKENAHLQSSVSTNKSIAPRLMESSTMNLSRTRSASLCSSGVSTTI